MNIFELFINFVNSILDFKILGFSIYTYLITISVIVIVVEIIKNMAHPRGKEK